MVEQTSNQYSLLPLSVIIKAIEGDVSAINQVLKHYERYIAKLATRQIYDENGISHSYVDEEVRQLLENRLINTVLKFKLRKTS